MDDRITFSIRTKKLAEKALTVIGERGLHDPHVNVHPQIIKTSDGYAIQVSCFDRRVVQALHATLAQYDEP